MNIKQILKKLIVILSLNVFLISCTQLTSKEKLKFTVDETGQTIAIAVNEKSGYAVEKKDNVPCVTKNGKTIFKCQFITFDQYNNYRKEIKSKKNKKTYTYYKEGTKGKNKYVYFESNINGEKRYSYIVKVLGTTNANTGVVLINETSREDAQNTFKKVKLSIDIYMD